MEDLSQWYSSLDTIMQVFWGCALVSSFIFLIQFVLTLLGMDHSDMDVDFDAGDTMDLGGGLSLFSIKNLINFLVGFGWAGVSFYPLVNNPLLSVLIAAAVGVLFVFMFFFIRKQTKKLEANGAFNIEECEGKSAEVYLRIPDGRSGKGKVQISVRGSIHEIDAYTDGELIPTGRRVKVLEVLDAETLLVTPL